MPATTAGPARMFPWQAKSTPCSPPCQSRHLLPVQVAIPPRASAIPTWRESHTESVAARARMTSEAESPVRRSAKALGPNDGSTRAWVATAPTPASAQGTSVPTLKYLDCTATPSSCVTESKATMENVPRSFEAEAGEAAARDRAIAARVTHRRSVVSTMVGVSPNSPLRSTPLRADSLEYTGRAGRRKGTMRADSTKPRPPLDPRYYQIAVLSGLLIYGLGCLHFDITLGRAALLLGTALLTQYACTKIWRLPRFDAKSAMISGL